MLHILLWRNGKLTADLAPEALPDVLSDPQSLVWLDIEGDPGEYADMLSHTFKLSHITIKTIQEERERAKFFEADGYFYVVTHGLSFDQKTEEADTPKLDIVFAQNYVVTAHRSSLDWLDSLRKSLTGEESEENIMARGMPSCYILYWIPWWI